MVVPIHQLIIIIQMQIQMMEVVVTDLPLLYRYLQTISVERLTDSPLSWLAVIDADGDHFANELINLTRAALAAHARFAADQVLVISLHSLLACTM